MTWHLTLADLAATERLAALLEQEASPGDVIALQGDLGAGKTAFARALIRARFGPLDVPSPTFNLLLTYGDGPDAIWHFDLYRLDNADEVYELGFEEALGEALSLIEWPERIFSLLPPECLLIRFEIEDDGRRFAVIEAPDGWAGRLARMAEEHEWRRNGKQ